MNSDFNAPPMARERRNIFSFKPVPVVISLAAAALIGWGVSLIPSLDDMKVMAGISTGLIIAIYLCTFCCVSGSRSATVIKTVAWTYFVISIIVGICMGIWCETYTYYILVNGLLLVSFLAIAYTLAKADQ